MKNGPTEVFTDVQVFNKWKN